MFYSQNLPINRIPLPNYLQKPFPTLEGRFCVLCSFPRSKTITPHIIQDLPIWSKPITNFMVLGSRIRPKVSFVTLYIYIYIYIYMYVCMYVCVYIYAKQKQPVAVKKGIAK